MTFNRQEVIAAGTNAKTITGIFLNGDMTQRENLAESLLWIN